MLDAVLERITYANEETGYTIARVATDRSGADLVTVVGALLGVQPGESLRLVGRWGSHPQYGRQFEVDSFTTVLPATIQGIERYLGSGLIKGIGPRTAGPDRRALRRGHAAGDRGGAGAAGRGGRVWARNAPAMIGRAWEEQKAIKEVMVFLQGVGVSTSLAVRIYKKYGDGSISVVRNEPYRLAAEVWGIGFKTADTIAQAVGIPHDSPQRVQAGIQYTLSEAADNGHCYLPEPNLLTDAAADPRRPRRPGPRLPGRPGRGRGGDPRTGPNPASTAGRSRRCIWCRSTAPRPPWPPRLLRLSHHAGRPDARLRARSTGARRWRGCGPGPGRSWPPEQEQAVRLALTAKVAVLTGGPGCGKSFTVKSVITLAAAKRAKIVLAAPTGRAAKRLDRAVRAPGHHRAPAAAAAPRRGPQLTTGTTRSTPT